ncbi:unnamed protein product [Ceutorhynchus assimilis]|uniref:RING-type domain-containing protein n=1 Tax=Ceutorhynchus assimilis TaxID=467358 RepID=A0A9N9QB11_9CUCU|nr:unnamed protein product [Ceutorhynchus assimilis]
MNQSTQSRKRKRKESKLETEKCSICLTKLRKYVASPKNCRHLFCLGCLKRWSRTQNTCPICRRRFSRIEVLNQRSKKLVRVLPVARADQQNIQLNRIDVFLMLSITTRLMSIMRTLLYDI